MSLAPSCSSADVSSMNERRQWRSRKRQGKKKVTFFYLIKDVCSSSESCLEWMKEMGFIPKVMFCPSCCTKMKFEFQENSVDEYLWECENDKTTISVRHGTWFDNTDISLIEILLLTYLWIHGFSKKQIMKELNIGEESYEECNSKLSSICEKSYHRTLSEEQQEPVKINYKTHDFSDFATRNPVVMMWLHKNKSRDFFIEFLKDADSLH